MGNPFVHVELMSTDAAKAKEFFGKLFDWQLDDMPVNDMPYTMIRVGEGTGGGMMGNPIPNALSMWVVSHPNGAAERERAPPGIVTGTPAAVSPSTIARR